MISDIGRCYAKKMENTKKCAINKYKAIQKNRVQNIRCKLYKLIN